MKFVFVILCLFSSGSLFSQSDTIPPTYNQDIHYLNFISKTIRYPREAAVEGIEGSVDFAFEIDSMGCINSIEIVQSPHELLSNALIKAISKTSCNWIPARIHGKVITSSLRSKFLFKLK